MRVLVVGAGISDLTVASGLHRSGQDVTVIERREGLRGVGHMMDFFAPGYDLAERMGLLGTLAQIHYPIAQTVVVDRQGKTRPIVQPSVAQGGLSRAVAPSG